MKDSASDLFAATARLPDLETLFVFFEMPSVIRGRDLIAVAEGCQKLIRMSLESRVEDYEDSDGDGFDLRFPLDLDGSDVKDAHIDSFSSSLPHLEEIRLECSGILSTKSLYHLGRNCPELRLCELEGCVLNALDFFQIPSSDQSVTSGNDLSGSQQPRKANLGSTSAITQDAVEPGPTKQMGAEGIRPLFPKLRSLEINRVIKYKSTSIDEIVSCLCTKAPRLEWFRIHAENSLQKKLEAAFYKHPRK